MEGSYGRVKDLQEDEHNRITVAKTRSSAWLTTAADMIEAETFQIISLQTRKYIFQLYNTNGS